MCMLSTFYKCIFRVWRVKQSPKQITIIMHFNAIFPSCSSRLRSITDCTNTSDTDTSGLHQYRYRVRIPISCDIVEEVSNFMLDHHNRCHCVAQWRDSNWTVQWLIRLAAEEWGWAWTADIKVMASLLKVISCYTKKWQNQSLSVPFSDRKGIHILLQFSSHVLTGTGPTWHIFRKEGRLHKNFAEVSHCWW